MATVLQFVTVNSVCRICHVRPAALASAAPAVTLYSAGVALAASVNCHVTSGSVPEAVRTNPAGSTVMKPLVSGIPPTREAQVTASSPDGVAGVRRQTRSVAVL
jgi:hypothetical protein